MSEQPDHPPRSRSPGGWEAVLDDPDAPLYTVGTVAELVGVDPQVVRGYDRRGLVEPDRSDSGHRRYSRRDIRRLSRAMELAAEGIPAAGIQRILDLEDRLAREGRQRARGRTGGPEGA